MIGYLQDGTSIAYPAPWAQQGRGDWLVNWAVRELSAGAVDVNSCL